ncbi:MAG: hypothetical protein Fur002_16230 [Anaerolineales bacterium]
MNAATFKSYKTRYRAAIQKVLSESEKGRLDEAGFPAYSHRNPYIHWLFWRRLHKAINFAERGAPYARVLDFGCGSGVMLPFLSEISREVCAYDVDLLPLRRVEKYIPLRKNVKIFDAAQTDLSSFPAASFDLITALDVLEHVQDLPAAVRALMKLLKPGGRLLVSGPTENLFYQMGRRLAGPEYSGAYHERGIAEIKRELASAGDIQPIALLHWYLPLFEVFAVSPK